MRRITRFARRILRRRQESNYDMMGMPSAILAELAEMGVVDIATSIAKPMYMDPGEAEKARWYARHGHWAFVNTNR